MTTLQPQTWEYTLLGLAHEALHPAVLAVLKPVANRHLLQRAYAYCTELTSAHSRSFYLATRWLPAGKRRAIRALSAFCRVSDDIVDCGDCDVEKKLAAWRHAALSSQPATNDLVAIAWADARLRYRIPQRYAEQLIEGVARDLTQKRYQTFEDLAAYAYRADCTRIAGLRLSECLFLRCNQNRMPSTD